MVSAVICHNTRRLELGLDVHLELLKFFEEQKESIHIFLKKDQAEPQGKRRKTMQRMKNMIHQYVNENCDCCNNWLID